MSAPEQGTPTGVTRADDGQAERLHNFSHGLRNKLTGMFEALRLLREVPEGVESTEVARFAEMQFFQALREVEHLLDDFGIERGTGRLTMQRVMLDELARTAMALAASRCEKKKQHVELTGSDPVAVQGESYYLEEVLAALLSNASKFSPTGATIHIGIHTDAGDAVITVRDHGVGLNTDDLQHIFTRFAWLSSQSTAGEDQGRGTLARVRSWVMAHGGSITVHSEGTGAGTLFTIRLPRIA